MVREMKYCMECGGKVIRQHMEVTRCTGFADVTNYYACMRCKSWYGEAYVVGDPVEDRVISRVREELIEEKSRNEWTA